MGKIAESKLPMPFNSAFELGIRMAMLLLAIRPERADLQKLVLLDYALVYSADLGGPSSLHTPVPQRGSELFSRRSRIQQGLYLMSSKEVVEVSFSKEDGIEYGAGRACRTFVTALTYEYFRQMEVRAAWVADSFGKSTSNQLTEIWEREGRFWGAEIESNYRIGT